MNESKLTACEIIRDVLWAARGQWLAVHEITGFARNHGDYISDNAAATRLSIDLKREVESRYRDGKHFKEWRLKAVVL